MLWFGWILLALRMANHWSSCYPGLSRVVTVGVTELLFLVEIMVIQWVCSWANLLISERTSSHFCEEPGKVFMVSLEGDLGQWFRDVVFNLCPAKDSELFRTTDHLFTSLGLKKKKKGTGTPTWGLYGNGREKCSTLLPFQREGLYKNKRHYRLRYFPHNFYTVIFFKD